MCGPLNGDHRQLVSVLGMVRIEAFWPAGMAFGRRPCGERRGGRPLSRRPCFQHSDHQPADRDAVRRQDVAPLMWLAARARCCFVDVFAGFRGEFAASALPSRLHEALIEHHSDRLVGQRKRHQSPNLSVAVPAREVSPAAAAVSRIERQQGMALAAMLADLPRACDVGAKRNAKGFSETWIGYKLHINTADGEIPISCVLTAVSVHDSQVAIPLATITAGRVTNLYDLMDSAYDVAAIKQHSRDLNHVPIIDINPRATPGLKQELAEEAQATPCRASHSGTSSLRRMQRGRAGQWRIKGQPRRANRAGVDRTK